MQSMFDLPLRIHWHLWKAYEHPGIHRHLRELARYENSTRDQWRAEQARKLRQLLSSANQNVPYYRQLFREADFDPQQCDLPESLSQIPVLTKDILRAEATRLISSNVDRSRLRANATGGSTGNPVNFYQDHFYHTMSTALVTHTYGWWGVRPHERTAIVWGSDRDLSLQSARERFYRWRSRIRLLDAFRMTGAAFDEFIVMLRQWRPRFLLGYASALDALATKMSPSDLGEHRFMAVCSSAENLFPHQRHRIEQAFGSPVYNFYGSREVSSLAAECPEHRLHMISNWRYLEIVNDEGQPVSDGELGYVAVTDLSNYAMPFIRYVNGDVGRIDPEPCPCGRPTPVLAKLAGRSSDLIRTPSGDIIHGEFFTHLFYGRHDIRQFQVHQTAVDQLVLRYVPMEVDTSHAIDPTLVQRIRDRMGPGVTIEVETCTEIPVPSSGKHRFTISDVEGLPAATTSV